MRHFIKITLIILLTSNIVSEEIKIIDRLKVTHKEGKIVHLKEVHTIPADFSEENFFAKPRQVLVNSKGDIYIYDRLLLKFFVFDSNYRFIRTIGSEGQGPGEFTKSLFPRLFDINSEDELVVTDTLSRRVTIFNSKGDYVETCKFSEKFDLVYPFLKNRKPFLGATGRGRKNMQQIVLMDENLNPIKNILTKEENTTFLLHNPIKEHINKQGSFVSAEIIKYGYTMLDPPHTKVEKLSKNLILIYLSNSSTLIKLNSKGEILGRHSIIPQMAAEHFQKAVKEKKRSKMLMKFFGDKNSGTFILGAFTINKKGFWYKFDKDLKLLETFTLPSGAITIAYGDNKVFRLKGDDIVIYK